MGAALTTINARGFDGCAIEDITELADVGKGTFYRHFHEKGDVLRELLDMAIDAILGRIAETPPQNASLETVLTSVLAAHRKTYIERPDLFLLFLQAQNMAATRPGSVPELQRPLTRYFEAIDRMVTPVLPPGTDSIKRRRVSCAASAAVAGFVAFAFTGMVDQQDLAGSLESVSQAFLAGVPRLLG